MVQLSMTQLVVLLESAVAIVLLLGDLGKCDQMANDAKHLQTHVKESIAFMIKWQTMPSGKRCQADSSKIKCSNHRHAPTK